MPVRMIRDGILTSDRITRLTTAEERFFVRLLLVADDYGCFDARTELLLRLTFPTKPEIRLKDVNRWLKRLAEIGLVSIVPGQPSFYVIEKFGQKLKNPKSEFIETDASISKARAPSVLFSSSLVSVSVLEEEKYEQPSEAPAPAAEPRKGVGEGLQAFLRSGPVEWLKWDFACPENYRNALVERNHEELRDSAEAYREYCLREPVTKGNFVKRPQNFLREGHFSVNWRKEVKNVSRNASPSGVPSRTAERRAGEHDGNAVGINPAAML